MDSKGITCHFLINIISLFCTAFKSELWFELRSNLSKLDGLTCAVSRYQNTRGVMFDPVTEMCIDLDNDWFSSPSYDPKLDYFILDSVTKLIGEKDFMKMDFPSNFVIGGSVILLMTTKTVGTTNGFTFAFQNQAETDFGFYMNLRENENAIIYNTNMDFRIFDNWGEEERKANPFKSSNKVYKLEFELTTAQTKTYIDDSHFYSYNHRTSVDNYQVIYFHSTISTVHQIQFTFPVPN